MEWKNLKFKFKRQFEGKEESRFDFKFHEYKGISSMVKQKYPLIVSSKAMKPCRETRRSLRVAAGTRDHLVDRVEDTLRQMSHSLGTKKERGREGGREGGRLGDREGLIRRWFPRVDRWTGHTMLPMDARCRWW